MIDSRTRPLSPALRREARDERSMRVVEYAMALVALAAAAVLAIR
ncbi:MAG TPA: hypothetical protein VFR14_02855 [Candidatus Limnocylindrales bacterium]|nr:hypothetical protein [Candidatus Limnocylindrales bacterium]